MALAEGKPQLLLLASLKVNIFLGYSFFIPEWWAHIVVERCS